MTESNPKKIALITGGSRGLGRSMALHLGERGVDVVVTYVRAEAEAAEVVRLVETRGGRAAALRLDVGDASSFAAFRATLQSTLEGRFGRTSFDYLVHNAGTGLHALVADTTEAQFDALVNVHLKGPFFLTQALLPQLADGGSILNISSGLTRFSFPGASAYAMMKGGLEVFSRYLARELAGRKITANTLAPGAIETDFGGGRVRDDEALNKMVAAQTALGRVGLPEDIGRAVAMLLSPDSAWITGQRIEASGGMLL